MYLQAMCMPSAYSNHKATSIWSSSHFAPPELELRMVASCLVGAGNRTPTRTELHKRASVLSHCSISPAPIFSLLTQHMKNQSTFSMNTSYPPKNLLQNNLVGMSQMSPKTAFLLVLHSLDACWSRQGQVLSSNTVSVCWHYHFFHPSCVSAFWSMSWLHSGTSFMIRYQ